MVQNGSWQGMLMLFWFQGLAHVLLSPKPKKDDTNHLHRCRVGNIGGFPGQWFIKTVSKQVEPICFYSNLLVLNRE